MSSEPEPSDDGRSIQPLDGLLAQLGAPHLEPLLDAAARAFAGIARAPAVVLRLREGDKLKSRAAVGVAGEVERNSSAPLGDWAQPAAPGTAPRRVDDPSQHSDAMRDSGVTCWFGIPLWFSDRLLGVIYLGSAGEPPWPALDERLLAELSRRVAPLLQSGLEREQLRQAVRSRDDMLSIVAHDLQNPINVISIAASMLLQRLADPAARRPLERIIRGAQRADRMVRDLLEITAIETGRFAIERRRIQPADLILSALESQQSLAADASIIIASDVAPNLPPIDADEERLLEVLENIIGNAIKFTSPGGTIKVGANLQGEELLVSVCDTGKGIAPEHLPYIFERFWQAKKEPRRGTGLGLTICKAIVEAHGGRIWAESSAGTGTTISFTLPAGPPRPQYLPTDVANILLVDDRPENLVALRAILERPDYHLVSASSGEEALRLSLREQFAVALIDVAMPGMNGFDVAMHLKELERSRDIPIIFITAFGDDPEEIHRAYSAGGADYLVKPLDSEIVKRKVAVFVDLSRRRNRMPDSLEEPLARN